MISKTTQFTLKTIAAIAVIAAVSATLYTNCGQASLGMENDTGGNGTQSVVSNPQSCPTNQVPVGINSSQAVICAPLVSSTTTMCPASDSLWQQISSSFVFCVSNASWNQTGSMCPVGEYLTSYTSAGAISCTLPTGLDSNGNQISMSCPTGQYVNGVQNNVPVCAGLPSGTPNASLCAANAFLSDENQTGLVCQNNPWNSSTAQACAAGQYALGFLNGQILCAQNQFNSGTANFACPSGQVLLSYNAATGAGSCSPPPNPDLSHACPAGMNVTSISATAVNCSNASTGGGPQCGLGQFVVGLASGSPICATVPANSLPASCPALSYPIGVSNGAVVCTPFTNERMPSSNQVCTPNQSLSCAVAGGMGAAICSADGTSISACVMSSCNSGYTASNGVCVANACSSGQTQACSAANGSGTQSCSANNQWASCVTNSCNSGFFLNNNACVADVCTPGSSIAAAQGNSTGIKTCLADGSGYGPYVATACANGYSLQNGACVDTSPPQITFTAQTGLVQGSNENIAFAVIDNQSGVKSVSCQLDGVAYSACTSPVQLTGLANGDHKFTVVGVDNTGNTATQNFIWTAQVCSGAQACAMANGSGAQACQADGTYGACQATSCSAGYQVTGGQCSALSCAPGYSISGNACVDNTPPTLTVQPFASPVVGTSATATFVASDLGSGVASITCALDSLAPAQCASPFTMSNLGVGSHKLTIVATDGTGNKVTQTFTWMQVSCNPGAVTSCPIQGGTGSETCAADGSGFGQCRVTSCATGYQQSGNSCVAIPTTCTINGKTVANGASVTGYSASSVAYGSSCSSVQATLSCNNGVVTSSKGSPASYTNSSCSVRSFSGVWRSAEWVWTWSYTDPRAKGIPACPNVWPGGQACTSKGQQCWVWANPMPRFLDDDAGNWYWTYRCN